LDAALLFATSSSRRALPRRGQGIKPRYTECRSEDILHSTWDISRAGVGFARQKPEGLVSKNMNARVTWLLPVKNGMPYLTEALASIEAQTFDDWEVLAWDNGSTDGTVEELRTWIPARLPGRIVAGYQLGLGASLRELVLLAETKLCARMDADDVNMPDRLRTQVEFLHAHPDIAVIGTQALLLDQDGRECGPLYRLPATHQDIVNALLWGHVFWHPSVMFRREAVLQAGNYRDVAMEDFDLWMRMALCHRLANLEADLLQFRLHDQSTTAIAKQKNQLRWALTERFAENGPALCGCSAQQSRRLFARKHFCAAFLLFCIARHLDKTQGKMSGSRLRSASFVTSAKSLLAPMDIASRLIFAGLGPQRHVKQELVQILKDTLKLFRIHKLVISARRCFQLSRK
jgi:glycosyltransferase involved in cell wall biosynthesis